MTMSMMAVEAEVAVTDNDTLGHTSVQTDDPSYDLSLPVLNSAALRRCPS